MSLNKGGLVAALTSSGFSSDAANAIANAIDAYVKTASIAVNTTGTAAAQTGTGIIS